VNNASITLRFGNASGNTASVSANQATYLGTLYATANGQTGVALKPAAASGGTANIIGLFNAYNRVSATALCRDSTSSWTYATATWRAANGNNNNRISWVDGLQQVNIKATYDAAVAYGANGNQFNVGVNLNSTSATPNLYTLTEEAANFVVDLMQTEPFYPQSGFNFPGVGYKPSPLGGSSLQLVNMLSVWDDIQCQRPICPWGAHGIGVEIPLRVEDEIRVSRPHWRCRTEGAGLAAADMQ
jgi:hypothetical protein